MRIFAYIAWRYNSAAESTSLLSSVASLAIRYGRIGKAALCVIRGMPHRCGEEGGARTAIEGGET